MKTTPHKTERIHSLDSLRAVMMLLGLVIHSAITYGVIDYGNAWGLKDPNATHLSNDFIVSFIHAFRMQIFFVVAGFFGALLFYERTPKRMIQNRFMRIVNPFWVFNLILWPSIVFNFGYSNLVFAGTENAFDTAFSYLSSPLSFLPQRTFHLWFLYYLGLITFVSVGLGLLFKKLPKVSAHISKGFSWIVQRPLLRVLVFGALTCAVYFIMGTASVATSTSFVPDFNTFIYYFFFYIFGWVLFKSKNHLETFMKYDWAFLVLGFLLFSTQFILYQTFSFEMLAVTKSIMVWLFVFGITGLFIRYGSNHSSRMRYISDSSYWVYLVHLSFTAIIPGWIAGWELPATVKFLIVLTSTSVICFVTYHYFVRSTFIGSFLNGRRYSKKLSDIKKAHEMTAPEPELAVQSVAR